MGRTGTRAAALLRLLTASGLATLPKPSAPRPTSLDAEARDRAAEIYRALGEILYAPFDPTLVDPVRRLVEARVRRA
ncbi:hypothetical protein [Gryllotalpicola protaetiae]|uniref:Uncharacterized protein n=1 Tax=Gryllotalpicola protaetiae TaxID=2419771 RepID=A0A387BLZ8_9MICO|nr:hypothetical protein [Gryllotalpicola protaetiae]AYG03402.1 hypothetical protein D7I44_07555 [Gryllotalpicola protaetiae]